MLFVQEDVADQMIEMIAGAMEALTVGDPGEIKTDVGPVIDADAKKLLDEHLKWLDKNANKFAGQAARRGRARLLRCSRVL